MPDTYRTRQTSGRSSNRGNRQQAVVDPKRVWFTYLFIGFVVIYLIAQVIIFINRDTTNYVVAKRGEITETIATQGVVVRSETLVKSNVSGIVQYYFPSGEELMKNTLVCSIMDDYYGNILEEKINEIYEQIQEVDSDEYAEAFEALDSDITDTIASYLRSRSQNKYSSLYNLQDDLLNAVSRRKDMYSLMSNTKVAALLQEQGVYINEQNSVLSNLYLSEAGVIDYSYDKYEGWNVDQIGSDFIEIYDSHYEYFEINMQSIESGTPLYRLISSPVWNIVIYLTEAQAEYFSGEEEVSFVYNSSTELTGYVASLTQTGRDQYKLVIKVTTRVQDFLNDRIVDCVFSKNSHTGIKIPESCLVEETHYVIPKSYLVTQNSESGVLWVNGTDTQFVKLDIITSNDEYVYFEMPEELGAGSIIRNEEGTEQMYLGETATVAGVYIVNGGYEDFQVVEVEYQAQGYAIVEGVEMYDRVRVGVSSVTD